MARLASIWRTARDVLLTAPTRLAFWRTLAAFLLLGPPIGAIAFGLGIGVSRLFAEGPAALIIGFGLAFLAIFSPGIAVTYMMGFVGALIAGLFAGFIRTANVVPVRIVGLVSGSCSAVADPVCWGLWTSRHDPQYAEMLTPFVVAHVIAALFVWSLCKDYDRDEPPAAS